MRATVTIEKWQGDKVEPYITEETAWKVAARQIKDRNPNITVIVWMDSLRIYTDDTKLNPDLGPACTTGHFGPAAWLESGQPDGTVGDPKSPYLLKNKSGLPALESWSKCHVIDHTKPIGRNFWTDMCLNMTRSGVIDGCGADASWQNGVDQAQKWELDDETAAAWNKGHQQAMRQTTSQLAPNGVLLGKMPYEVGDYVNGALHEGCDADNTTILTLRNLTAIAAATDQRLVYECHGGRSSLINELAAFLIGAGKYQYYGLGGWAESSFEGHRPSEFDKPLGAPLTDGQYDVATGVWTRKFASGTRVSFNANTKQGNITWAS